MVQGVSLTAEGRATAKALYGEGLTIRSISIDLNRCCSATQRVVASSQERGDRLHRRLVKTVGVS